MSVFINHFEQRRRAVLVTAAAAWGLLLSGAAFAQAAPAQIRIGFQKSAVNLVILKQQGALEKRFPNARVQWVEFPAGPQLLEALSVGSLEFGLTGDSPPVFAQAAGKELRYVGAEPSKPRSSAILVKQEAPIRTLADLKGRKIALQKGSSAHYLLLRAVEKAGLAWSDITPIYLPPSDARAAFERGSVDAWAIWDPYYAATELDIAPRVLATGEGLSGNNSFYLASTALAEKHPQALQVLFEELTRADAYVQSHRKEAAQLISDFSGLGLATVHRFIERRPPSPVAPLTPAITAEQQRVADAFAALGLIPRQVKVAEIVWQPPGATKVAQQATGGTTR
ncbi:sulfonate ABC transporter substrate-binding protein [Rivibacter subsaxonicus]|uniref:Putative aliphatic sulfonates-binding protein n=1 Tax=Rivibacter subsaxonicus TaxID=457575 RepID=A0A4V6MEP5_9BURK|nr:sulfonate ABC transporter substrate-binding protein [Rivibacter subsaxonicus]RZU00946.1 sulfonate transport system substrate-binding protein [Rivibacter subsaxonicus]